MTLCPRVAEHHSGKLKTNKQTSIFQHFLGYEPANPQITRSLAWFSGCSHSQLISIINESIYNPSNYEYFLFLAFSLFFFNFFLFFGVHANWPQSFNSFTFNHTLLVARESPERRHTVQKCLITAAFQIKRRRCIIHLWRIPLWTSHGIKKPSNLVIAWYKQFGGWDPGETHTLH